LGRDAEEIDSFKTIGRGWFKKRDQTAHAERFAAVKHTAESIDLNEAIRNVGTRSRADVESMVFAGNPMSDWLAYVKELSRLGRDDEALDL
jgi:hypothetical protein